jgi:hypothetical protein
VIATGGFGPTVDDLRAGGVDLLGLPMAEDAEVLRVIEERFRTYRFQMADNNRRQAMVPRGAEVLPNPLGTAPGLLLRPEGRLLALLPGVPIEMERMVLGSLLPRLGAGDGPRPSRCGSRGLGNRTSIGVWPRCTPARPRSSGPSWHPRRVGSTCASGCADRGPISERLTGDCRPSRRYLFGRDGDAGRRGVAAARPREARGPGAAVGAGSRRCRVRRCVLRVGSATPTRRGGARR